MCTHTCRCALTTAVITVKNSILRWKYLNDALLFCSHYESNDCGFSNFESMVDALLRQEHEENDQQEDDNTTNTEEAPEEPPSSSATELKQLVESRKCKSCHKEDACVVLVPCGHLACCVECGNKVNRCPVCRSQSWAFKKYTVKRKRKFRKQNFSSVKRKRKFRKQNFSSVKRKRKFRNQKFLSSKRKRKFRNQKFLRLQRKRKFRNQNFFSLKRKRKFRNRNF